MSDQVEKTEPTTEPQGGEPVQWGGMASQFPKETREKYKDLLLGDYKDKKAHEVFEELVDAKGKLGRAIVIPDPKTASPEEIAAFKKTMGIPEGPDKYDIKADAYKDIDGIEGLVADFRTRAAAWGLTKSQAQGVFDLMAGLAKAGLETQIKAKQEHKESFQARLLEAVGKDEKKAEEVTNRMKEFLVKRIGDPEIVQDLADSGLLYSAKFAVKIAELSRAFDDTPYIRGAEDRKGQPAKGAMGDYSPEFRKAAGG